jgi:hypothetical protein
MTCKLGHNVQMELFDSFPRQGGSMEDFQETVAAFVRDVSKLENRHQEFVEDVVHFRRHLSRRLSALRRKNLEIKGSIEMGRVRVGDLSDALPILSLICIGKDLRPMTLEGDVECYDDIDVPLKNIAEQAAD